MKYTFVCDITAVHKRQKVNKLSSISDPHTELLMLIVMLKVSKWQNQNLECYCHEPHCPYWVAQSKLCWQRTLKQLVKCLSSFASPGSLWMIYEFVPCVSINVAMKFCILAVAHYVRLKRKVLNVSVRLTLCMCTFYFPVEGADWNF